VRATIESRRYRLRLPRSRGLELVSGAPAIFGIVNVTPDSFSDGGRFLDPDRAVEHALRLLDEGADALDLGGESTRPGGGVYGDGAPEISVGEELDRVLPVLERLRPLTVAPLSIDTRRAPVASAALGAGADLVNDVSALGDPEMAAIVAAAGCPIVLMHSRGERATMQKTIRFDDVVGEVRTELEERRGAARAAGIDGDQVLVDPGLGFGKTAEQNLELLRATDRLVELGAPLVVGASRKSFLGLATGAPVGERLPGSLAAAAAAALGGAAVLRVHDVAATRQFLAVWRELALAGGRS
jgi:dihydropteroate synthase